MVNVVECEQVGDSGKEVLECIALHWWPIWRSSPIGHEFNSRAIESEPERLDCNLVVYLG